jgi:diguanylate cyclase (GGDEF)-like protein
METVTSLKTTGSYPWSGLRDDPFVRVTAIVFLTIATTYVFPILSPEIQAHLGYNSELPLLLIAIAAFVLRWRSVDSPEERRFFGLWALALCCWLAVRIWNFFQPESTSIGEELGTNTFYVGFYLAIALALDGRAHLRISGFGRRLRALEAAGAIVFVSGLMLYFGIVPALLNPQAYRATSLLLYVTLDLYIASRLLFLWKRCGSPAWRVIYGWLAAGTSLWLIVDCYEMLMWAELLPYITDGTPVDLLWLAPLIAVIIAVRLPQHPGHAVQKKSLADRPTDLTAAVVGGTLVIYAVTFPLLHFSLYATGFLDPMIKPPREILSLLFLIVLGGLVVLYQDQLRSENSRLEKERQRTQKEVEFQAYHDALTGLPNRHLFFDHLELAIAQSRRSQDRLAIMFLDLDRFKMINDSLGHSVGDELLVAVASRLRQAVRQGDTLARLGGDEFTVLMTKIQHVADAAKLAQHLLEAVRGPFVIDGLDLFVTTSIGVGIYPEDGADAETLVKHSDVAMYRAKELGRDTYRLFTAAMNAEALERLELQNSLRRGLALDQFELHYQPIVELGSRRLLGCEALLRWRHPDRGLLEPSTFIERAEATGLIVPIGFWALRTACARVEAWRKQKAANLLLTVNLSTRQLEEEGFVESVRRILDETGLDPGQLELEITESMRIEDIDSSALVARSLKDLGIRISIDDFGTGFSALTYLRRLPVDTIKIDGSFVRRVHETSHDSAIVAAITAMANRLGIHVIAEGIEEEEQLEVLRQHGCQRGQGFLFSPALPPDQFEQLIASNREALRS